MQVSAFGFGCCAERATVRGHCAQCPEGLFQLRLPVECADYEQASAGKRQPTRAFDDRRPDLGTDPHESLQRFDSRTALTFWTVDGDARQGVRGP